MRFNPNTNTLVWISEGASGHAKYFCSCKILPSNQLIWKFVNEFDLPSNLRMQKEEQGPEIIVLEGLTFDKTTLYANIEEPLYEDDNPASITKGGLIRLYQFNAKSRKTLPNTPSRSHLHTIPAKGSLCCQWCLGNSILRQRPIASSRTLLPTGTQACT
jgi:hypothetical protein